MKSKKRERIEEGYALEQKKYIFPFDIRKTLYKRNTK